jgi:hypothetical protein
MLEKIKKIQVDLEENMLLNSGYFITILHKNLGKLSGKASGKASALYAYMQPSNLYWSHFLYSLNQIK